MLMCVYVGRAEEEHQLVMPQMPNVHSSQAGVPAKYVVGFGKMVDVFSSKQRPKKLTIYGDDFRCVPFGVSGSASAYNWCAAGHRSGQEGAGGMARGQKAAGRAWGRECWARGGGG